MNSILLASHVNEDPGPINKFYDFLIKKYKVSTITHPLHLNGRVKNTIKFNGKKFLFNIPLLLQYPFEGIITLFFWKKIAPKNYQFNIAICFDPLCFFHLYFLRRFFRIKKIVYYNVDYSKNRYTNPILNFIYQKMNLFAYRKCDYFFSINRRFIEDLDPTEKFIYKNFSITHLTKLSDKNSIRSKKKNSIVYAGTTTYTIDFDPLFTALKRLTDEGVNFVFDIYGNDRENILKTKIIKLHLEKNVFLKGVIENKKLTQEILPKYLLGVAPYVTKRNISFPDHAGLGTDLSLKLVEYIAAGLPVVTTRPHAMFDLIVKNKFGYLVKDTHDWYKAILSLLQNKKIYQYYKKNALQYAKNYNEEKILKPIFDKLLAEN